MTFNRSRIGTDPALALETRRGTGTTRALIERVVVSRAIGHNGSVVELEHWFTPQRLTPDSFRWIWRLERSTRGSKGHEYGLRLMARICALFAYLRPCRPLRDSSVINLAVRGAKHLA